MWTLYWKCECLSLSRTWTILGRPILNYWPGMQKSFIKEGHIITFHCVVMFMFWRIHRETVLHFRDLALIFVLEAFLWKCYERCSHKQIVDHEWIIELFSHFQAVVLWKKSFSYRTPEWALSVNVPLTLLNHTVFRLSVCCLFSEVGSNIQHVAFSQCNSSYSQWVNSGV